MVKKMRVEEGGLDLDAGTPENTNYYWEGQRNGRNRAIKDFLSLLRSENKEEK
jgi:hypothetical protein